jgi:Rrf2 family protein
VNLSLSRKGDYCVRAAIYLGRNPGAPVKIKEIVAAMDIPPSFGSQILADLAKAGIAESKPGRDGGYWLARDPAQIKLLEIVEAGEGPVRADRCALGDGPCRWESVCPLHQSWQGAVAAVRKQLANTTLADIVSEDLRIESGAEVPVDSHRQVKLTTFVDQVTVETPKERALSALAALSEEQIRLVAEQAFSLDTNYPLQITLAIVISHQNSLVIEGIDPAGKMSRIEADLSFEEEDEYRCRLDVSIKVRSYDEVQAKLAIRKLATSLARQLESYKQLVQ